MYVDLLDPEIEDLYRKFPKRLEQQVRALPCSVEWVLIDEIQRAPRLLDVVHRLIESTGKRFVLTGSSARKLRRGASNLLAGPGLRPQPVSTHRAGTARGLRSGRCPALGNAAPDLLTGRTRGQAGIPACLRLDLPERRDRRRADRQKAGSVPAIPGGVRAIERPPRELRQSRQGCGRRPENRALLFQHPGRHAGGLPVARVPPLHQEAATHQSEVLLLRHRRQEITGSDARHPPPPRDLRVWQGPSSTS